MLKNYPGTNCASLVHYDHAKPQIGCRRGRLAAVAKMPTNESRVTGREFGGANGEGPGNAVQHSKARAGQRKGRIRKVAGGQRGRGRNSEHSFTISVSICARGHSSNPVRTPHQRGSAAMDGLQACSNGKRIRRCQCGGLRAGHSHCRLNYGMRREWIRLPSIDRSMTGHRANVDGHLGRNHEPKTAWFGNLKINL